MQASKRYLLIIVLVWFIVCAYMLWVGKEDKQDQHVGLSHSEIDSVIEISRPICYERRNRISDDEIFQHYWNNSPSFEHSRESLISPVLKSRNFGSLDSKPSDSFSNHYTKSLLEVFEEKETSNDVNHRKYSRDSSLLAIRQYINNRPSPGLINDVYEFESCRMSTCFDYRRCNLNHGLKVHVVPMLKANDLKSAPTTASNIFNDTAPNSLIYTNILNIIRKSTYYEPDSNKACLFVSESHTLDRDPLSASFREGLNKMIGSHNDYGLNYLIFNLFSGSWPDYFDNDYSGLQIGASILAKASISRLHYRPGFDISLPLFNISHPIISSNSLEDDQDDNRARKYLISFKGKRYTVGNGSETRNSLFHLHNERDVIMLTTCRHGKKWRELKDRRCVEDNRNYDNYDYQQLMRESSFCLIPRGRRLGSYRFLEALYSNCIPVVLSNGWVKPFDGMIDWSNCVIQIDERLVLQVPDLLRSINQKKIVEMRRECKKIYWRYLSSIERIVLSTFSLIEKRLRIRSSYRQGFR